MGLRRFIGGDCHLFFLFSFLSLRLCYTEGLCCWKRFLPFSCLLTPGFATLYYFISIFTKFLHRFGIDVWLFLLGGNDNVLFCAWLSYGIIVRKWFWVACGEKERWILKAKSSKENQVAFCCKYDFMFLFFLNGEKERKVTNMRC